MRNSTKITLITLISTLMIGCAGIKRTKYSDPTMQVFIDPSVNPEIYVKVRSALVKSKKWRVIGRQGDFEAALREQNLLHKKVKMTDRFDNREKLAWLGKFKGAKGAILASHECTQVNTWSGWEQKCDQHLAFMDVNTGEIIAVADVTVSQDGNMLPYWDGAVEALNEDYPEHYEARKEHKILREYKDETEVRSVHAKEKLAREVIKKGR